MQKAFFQIQKYEEITLAVSCANPLQIKKGFKPYRLKSFTGLLPLLDLNQRPSD
jgi:hypothetical protein